MTGMLDGIDMRGKSEDSEARETFSDVDMTGEDNMRGKRKREDFDAHDTSEDVRMTGIFAGEDKRRKSEWETYAHAQCYISMVRGKWTLLSRWVELRKLFCEANTMYVKQNWSAAVVGYLDFIYRVGYELKLESLENVAWEDNYHLFILMAYSRRAEASLRLRHYEDALWAVNRALQIDPTHYVSLLRKGRAAYHLGLFLKACDAFKSAFVEYPEQQWLLQYIRESIIADEQSRTGDYDLTDFFLGGCRGEIPLCADFVGPVDIRRAPGRWGLFATKSLEPGELLIVSNPLAVVRRKPVIPIAGPRDGLAKKFIQELFVGVEGSKRQMARLYSLGSEGRQDVEIPSMELFRPRSEWIPPSALNLAVDLDYIVNIIGKKRFQYVDVTGAKEGDNTRATEVIGLWILPAFASHSCAPNCQHSFVGDTLFFRASRHLMEGEELTVSYFPNLFNDVKCRRATSKNWMFTCKCERCLFEENLGRHILWNTANMVCSYIPDVASQEFRQAKNLENEQSAREDSALKELATATGTLEIEALIESLGDTISHKQQGWIRAVFMASYVAATRVPEFASVWSLKLAVDSMISVYASQSGLGLAALLVLEFYRLFSDSEVYRDTLDQVHGIYRVYFGNLPRSTLDNLIHSYLPPLNQTRRFWNDEGRTPSQSLELFRKRPFEADD